MWQAGQRMCDLPQKYSFAASQPKVRFAPEPEVRLNYQKPRRYPAGPFCFRKPYCSFDPVSVFWPLAGLLLLAEP